MTVMLRQSRQATELAAWGLGRDGRGWWQQAACIATPDLHTADLGSGWQLKNSPPQARARHICLHHCPVLEQCQREAQRRPPREVTQAGLVWIGSTTNVAPRPSTFQPADPGCGSWCEEMTDAD